MLSPSAARMGCVKTTLRKIGPSGRRFRSSSSVTTATGGRREALLAAAGSGTGRSRQGLSYARAALAADVRRWKSTMASYGDYEDEDDSNRSHGHAEAAKARSTFSHEEAWMINLGRDDSNEWLTGTRDADEWFTGLKPSICPGT